MRFRGFKKFRRFSFKAVLNLLNPLNFLNLLKPSHTPNVFPKIFEKNRHLATMPAQWVNMPDDLVNVLFAMPHLFSSKNSV